MLPIIFSLLTLDAQAADLTYNWQWETSPKIEICPDSQFTINDVVSGLSYWQDKGVFVEITSINHVDHCDLKKRNVIQFMGDRNVNHDKEYAKTNIKWYYYGEKNEDTTLFIKGARIQIPNDNIEMESIVLHEIGHALGLGHSHHEIMKATH